MKIFIIYTWEKADYIYPEGTLCSTLADKGAVEYPTSVLNFYFKASSSGKFAPTNPTNSPR